MKLFAASLLLYTGRMEDTSPHPPALEESVGAVIRELRQKEGLTLAQVAELAGLSRGMLSKIETGSTMPGLDTLARVARALGVTMSELFRKYDAGTATAQHVKRGESMEVVRRGTRNGHTYHLLAYSRGPVKSFEPFLITMEDNSQDYPRFQHPGTEFLYMLEGVLEYRCGEQSYVLEPGDALTFNGETPHGPGELTQTPIKFLSVIVYPAQGAQEG